jgi:hypothetical protein
MWTRPVCVRPRSSRRVAPCHKHTAVRRVQVQPQCGGMWEYCGDTGGLRAVRSPPASERARSVPSRRLPLTVEPSRAASRGGLPPALLGPYRHTTATPHAAVRISMRYHLCAGGYLLVLCCLWALWCSVCAVCCWEERERAASLPVGRHYCREVAASLPGQKASLPSGIAAGDSVCATDWVCVRACIETALVDADAERCAWGRSTPRTSPPLFGTLRICPSRHAAQARRTPGSRAAPAVGGGRAGVPPLPQVSPHSRCRLRRRRRCAGVRAGVQQPWARRKLQ